MQCASVHVICICRFIYEHLTFQRKTYSLLSFELVDHSFLGQLFTSFSNNPRIKELVTSTHQAIAIGSMVNGPKFASNASMRYKNLGVTSGTVWRSNNPMHTISTHFMLRMRLVCRSGTPRGWHTHPIFVTRNNKLAWFMSFIFMPLVLNKHKHWATHGVLVISKGNPQQWMGPGTVAASDLQSQKYAHVHQVKCSER